MKNPIDEIFVLSVPINDILVSGLKNVLTGMSDGTNNSKYYYYISRSGKDFCFCFDKGYELSFGVMYNNYKGKLTTVSEAKQDSSDGKLRIMKCEDGGVEYL